MEEELDIGQVEDAQPEPAPAPEPVDVSPEPEPEPEPIEPDWLNAPEPEPAPAQAQQYPAQQQYYQPQYQQPQPTQPQGFNVERFVQNPEAELAPLIEQKARALVQEQLSRTVGPMAQEVLGQRAQISAQINAIANDAAAKASRSITSGYREVFSRDDGFRGNKQVRELTERHMRETFVAAKRAAAQGHQWGLETLRAMEDPAYAQATLAVAKVVAGQASAPRAVTMQGAHTEGARPSAKPSSNPEVPPDVREALERSGRSVESYLRALEEYGDDIEFHGEMR